MTNTYREQRPLLCDDYSDDEFDVKNYNYQRRKRPSVYSGRARNYAKGAVAIINRWPDNCSASVAYWWLGVSMIAIIIFVIYNSVLIFGMLPTADMNEPKYRIFNNEIKPKTQILSMPEVYMHLIINNDTDVFLKKYMRYVTVVSKKYPSFKYNFLILLNDTTKDLHDYKDEERNDIAFNSLWTNEKSNKKISSKYNIFIEHLSLSTYLNDSPIKKFWRHLPSHLIEFLVRSVSIWDKGGIAFNPKILIPNLYNRRYTDKLYEILNTYVNSSSKFAENKIKAKLSTTVNTRRPNNIQDIINELEKGDNNDLNTDLSVAENNGVEIASNPFNIMKFKRDLRHTFEMNNYSKGNNESYKSYENDTDINHQKNHNISNSRNSTYVADNILPLFLKYLFANKPENVVNTSNATNLKISKENSSLYESSLNLNQKPLLSAENILEVSGATNFKSDNLLELSIDMKGNIIATKTACHAFLGTMFSNVARHIEEETVTDFIVSELSLFCHGLLTSCAGINVILA